MTALAETSASTARWSDVCSYEDLVPGRGVCALVGGVQVALFRTAEGELHALSNFDPCGGAYVLSRGILGCRAGVPTVASPMFKQVFDLRTGACLDDPARSVPVFPARTSGAGRVEVALR